MCWQNRRLRKATYSEYEGYDTENYVRPTEPRAAFRLPQNSLQIEAFLSRFSNNPKAKNEYKTNVVPKLG